MAELKLSLGRAQVERRRWREADEALAPLIRDDVPSGLAALARYWSGRAALGAGRVAEAEAHFRILSQLDPGSFLAERGWLLLLDRVGFEATGGRTSRILDGLLRAGIVSSRGGQAAVRVGTDRYLRNDFEGAAAVFEGYWSATAAGPLRQQAAFWRALTHERAGEPALVRERMLEAFRQDPLSYYGLLAGEWLGAPVLADATPAGPSASLDLGMEVSNGIFRLRVHQLLPTDGSFQHELEGLTDFFRERGGGYDFAEALHAGGFPIQGIVLGRDIKRREGSWNLRLLRIVHPFPFRDVIVAEAMEQGLDPFLVAGLIRQESAFHPSIVSSAGAVGLMQLMPATARELAVSVGLRYSAAILTDARSNVKMGTQFLASVWRRAQGRVEDALSAYNAGPGRIAQWRKRPEYADPDVFVERIPIQETRSYVKAVQGYARVYHALYGCGEFQPCLGLPYRQLSTRRPVAGS